VTDNSILKMPMMYISAVSVFSTHASAFSAYYSTDTFSSSCCVTAYISCHVFFYTMSQVRDMLICTKSSLCHA